MKVRFEKGNKVSPVQELETTAEARGKARLLAESAQIDVAIVTFCEKRKIFVRTHVVSPKGDVRELRC